MGVDPGLGISVLPIRDLDCVIMFYYCLPTWQGIMFLPASVCVCVSVSLPVTNISKEPVDIFILLQEWSLVQELI